MGSGGMLEGMDNDEQHHCSSELPSTSDTSTEFATVVKKLAEGVSSASLDDHLVTEKQVKLREKVWLSKKQRAAIENSWKRANKNDAKEHVGTQIFSSILSARPEMKNLFGLQKIPEGRLKYDPRFRRHANVFVKSFDFIVKNIAYKEKLEQHFQALGERHTVFQGRGFFPEYWDTFNDCMNQTVLLWDKDRSHEAANTWHQLISFVLENMKIGFYRINNRRLQRSSRLQHTSHPASAVRKHGVDPLQFYRQFCHQQK